MLNYEIRMWQAGEWVPCALWPAPAWNQARQKTFNRTIPQFETREEAARAIHHLYTVEGERGQFGIMDVQSRELEEIPPPSWRQ